jgi:hypothetical protein
MSRCGHSGKPEERCGHVANIARDLALEVRHVGTRKECQTVRRVHGVGDVGKEPLAATDKTDPRTGDRIDGAVIFPADDEIR